MGIHSQLTMVRRHRRQGAALPAALFGLVMVSLLASAIFASSSLQSTASKNRDAQARALQLAEDGMAHAVTVVRDSLRGLPFTRMLRGTDNDPANTADNGILVGHGLSADIDIPAAGRTFGSGRYEVQIFDDADGDGNVNSDANQRVRVRCTATTSDSGRAVLETVIGVDVLPAIAANGDIMISGNPQVRGVCGAVHANDDISIGSGTIVAGTVSSSDDVTGSYRDTLGVTRYPTGNRPIIPIPPMTYEQFCGPPGVNPLLTRPDVEFWLSATGFVQRRGSAAQLATSTKRHGWKMSSGVGSHPVKWDFSNPSGTPGKYCIEGNVTVSSNVGSATSPMAWSIIALGSVSVSGNPYLVPFGGDSISIVSGGDVSISGNPTGSARSYEGLIFADDQCMVSGNPALAGQLLCYNNPTNTSQHVEYVATTSISGNPSLTYGCGGIYARRRIYSWVHEVP